MQQFTRKPVTVFRWDDTDAPQLPYNSPGAFKTVLKACLNTGYGAKQSLGWEIVDEDTNRIAVRSADPNSTQSVFWVDDSHHVCAQIRAYEAITDLDNTIGLFEHASNAAFEYYYKSTTSGKTAKWVIVGHNTAFAVVSWNTLSTAASPLFFGDIPSFKAGDQFNCLLLAWCRDNPSYNFSAPPLGLPRSSQNGFVAAMARAYDQVGKTDNLTCTSAVADGIYPDPITGGWIGAPAYICESKSLRGMIPGLIATRLSTNPDEFAFGATLPPSSNTSDEHIWVRQTYGGDRHGFVINTTAWLA